MNCVTNWQHYWPTLNRELPRGFLSFGICLIWRPGSRILKQNEGEIRELRIANWFGMRDTENSLGEDGIERKCGWGRWDWKNPLGTLWTTFCKISSLRKRRHLTIPPLVSSVRVETQAVCALRSLSIMGSIQNLIICVKMAWSEHLDCGVNIR